MESISSAIPPATLPTILYVAGATSIISAQSARAICSTFTLKFLSHISTATSCFDNDSNASGVIILAAFSVITTFTSYPLFLKPDTIFAALYAAIPPLTPIKIFFIILSFPVHFTFCLNYKILQFP